MPLGFVSSRGPFSRCRLSLAAGRSAEHLAQEGGGGKRERNVENVGGSKTRLSTILPRNHICSSTMVASGVTLWASQDNPFRKAHELLPSAVRRTLLLLASAAAALAGDLFPWAS